MGMFDNIMVECDMPDGTPSWVLADNGNFQTKDTPSQYMETYRITKDGKLIFEWRKRKFVKDKKSLFGGFLKTVSAKDVVMDDFHGDIRFISCRTENGAFVEHREYIARFTNGKLDYIREAKK